MEMGKVIRSEYIAVRSRATDKMAWTANAMAAERDVYGNDQLYEEIVGSLQIIFF